MAETSFLTVTLCSNIKNPEHVVIQINSLLIISKCPIRLTCAKEQRKMFKQIMHFHYKCITAPYQNNPHPGIMKLTLRCLTPRDK